MNEAFPTDSKWQHVAADVSATIIAEEDDLAPLRGELLACFGQALKIEPLPIGTPLPTAVLDNNDVLIIQIDPAWPASLRRIEQARAANPAKLLIAAVPNLEMKTMRELLRRGVNDVVSMPFNAEELYSAVVYLAGTQLAPQMGLAPMWSIAHSSGGVGGSTIASHLADRMAQADPDTRCCLVDLDVQFGELAMLLGAGRSGNIVDCLEAGDRLDFEIVSNALTEITPNLFLLSPPREVVPAGDLDTDRLLALLTMLRQNFDFVLLDLPAGWSEATLSAACASTEILLVVEQNVRSLDRAKKTIDVLESVDFPTYSVKLVVNRAEKRLFQAIRSEEVEQTLDREVVASVPAVKSGLGEAQERGVLFTDEEPRSAFAKAIDELADYLLSSVAEDDR